MVVVWVLFTFSLLFFWLAVELCSWAQQLGARMDGWMDVCTYMIQCPHGVKKDAVLNPLTHLRTYLSGTMR